MFTGTLTWRQLGVYVRHLPRESALGRELAGDDYVWDLHAHLIAAALDTLRAANYQRAGGKGAKPKPTPRPGVNGGVRRIGRTDRSPEEVAALLARSGPSRPPQPD